MKTNPTSSVNITRILSAIFLTYLLVACDVDGSNNFPRVPEVGLFIYAEANQHEAQDEVQLAAAVFKDGEPVNLVAGDVFEAQTTTQRVLLKDSLLFAGSYTALLTVDDNVQDVFFNIVHEPIEAREDRWYPIDIINIDPGPGELVGKSATASFPPKVTITGPVAASAYTSIDDVIHLEWEMFGAGDTMKVLSAVSCSNGLAETQYGTVVEIADDDGWEDITLDKFIFDIYADSPDIQFISNAVQALLQELLNKLSAGNIDPDFLARSIQANPVSSDCEIRLFLQRQRKGQFDAAFDDGVVVGSRSAEVIVNYVPVVPAN